MKDFRLELYNKYITTFTKLISNENSATIKSEYIIFRRRYLKLISKFSKDAPIIDIGCGVGHNLNFLKQEGFNNLYGIDISEQQVNSARAKLLNADVINIFDFLNQIQKI